MGVGVNNFGRIGVLMGGASSERDISLNSGKAVYECLKNLSLEAVCLDIKSDDYIENRSFIREAGIDTAFIALHGHFGEDGQIQSLLEELNIPYTGSDPDASRLAMDKVASRKVFQKEALPVPNYIVFCSPEAIDSDKEVTSNLTAPFVVKPAAQGSSIGLSIVNRQEQLKEALRLASNYDKNIIIEEYIEGREITVGILAERALPVIEIIPKNKFYDYEAKYAAGMSEYVVPAELPADIACRLQEIGLAAHRSLGCFAFSRVDIRLNRDNAPFILEVNSIPGLTSVSLLPKAASAAGIDFSQLCTRILRLALERARAH
ncbi:MAG: D-alanine--D-alanine ligase [Candidatus Omnitrophica bacterium]|nr:D-alanine--D-alanine ligase [Candidatus Omnitrophota bacterium]